MVSLQETVFGMKVGQRWEKRTEWKGKAFFVPTQWSEEEFQMHLDSNRIVWRECPGTHGVYEYKDTQSTSMVHSVDRTKEQQGKQKESFLPESDEHHKFLNDWGVCGA